MNAEGSALLYSTFTDTEGGQASQIALDSEGDATITLQKIGGLSGYVIMRLNPEGSGTVFSISFLPGIPNE